MSTTVTMTETVAPATVFYADAVLFDMDGTLTDSIQAVEAAWGKVAKDIGQDPEHVIAATHGKRAIDNLAEFKPHLKTHEMDGAVQNFEESILFYADAYNTHGPGSRNASRSNSMSVSTRITPDLSPDASRKGSVSSPESSSSSSRRPSFATRLGNLLSMSTVPERDVAVFDEEEEDDAIGPDMEATHTLEAWQVEAAGVDRSVQILPGVKRMIESIPVGRYAVATSGAKTYAYGCMTRVGIVPPPVTITADDKRLKRGKPHPDPFLLAAKCLGYDAKKCVVFEDSPSGIRAGVASGATVVAVCTSHERSKIENCGAHYIIENMENIHCKFAGGRLEFTITS